jgi:hypothetical protein
MSAEGCPGAQTIDLRGRNVSEQESHGEVASQLRQWPIQLHLVNPNAPYFKGADALLRKVPIKSIVVSLQGEVLSEAWAHT